MYVAERAFIAIDQEVEVVLHVSSVFVGVFLKVWPSAGTVIIARDKFVHILRVDPGNKINVTEGRFTVELNFLLLAGVDIRHFILHPRLGLIDNWRLFSGLLRMVAAFLMSKGSLTQTVQLLDCDSL